MTKAFAASLLLGSATLTWGADHYSLHVFRKIQATDKFWAEGACFGDFNRDGRMDVVAGPFWYEGPEFKQAHEYSPARATFTRTLHGQDETVSGFEGALGSKNAYSDNFLAFARDLNGDGWTDIIIVGFPGAETFWYQNPQGAAGHWARHVVLDVTDNESPAVTDLVGDATPELVCNSKGFLGYATPDPSHPTRMWTYHPISPNKNYHRYTHGLGVGDVNGDGRMDVLEKDGWWEQPESLAGDPVWKHHPFAFAPGTGSSQMYAYDVNGDGLNDVITSLNAHGYGLAWYEHVKEGGHITFKKHLILNEPVEKDQRPDPGHYGVIFSQLHAVELTDVDGDGLKDIITGKRFWAHGPTGDVEPNAPAVLYWFKLTRPPNAAPEFLPFQIDDNSGVGTQVFAGKLDPRSLPSIAVGNKKGAFVFVHEVQTVERARWEQAQPKRQ